jgi:hypothetical protein
MARSAPYPCLTLTIRLAARTDTGPGPCLQRSAAYIGRHLLAVADRLGGHVASEIPAAAVIGARRQHDLPVPGNTKFAGVVGKRAPSYARSTSASTAAAMSSLPYSCSHLSP